MTYRLKSMHKKNSELQKLKKNVKIFSEHLILRDTNETIEKLKLSDKDKELLRKALENE